MITSDSSSSASNPLRRPSREELLRHMTSEARATYERIKKLREEIGPINFNVVKALRELRGGEEEVMGRLEKIKKQAEAFATADNVFQACDVEPSNKDTLWLVAEVERLRGIVQSVIFGLREKGRTADAARLEVELQEEE